MRDRTPRGTEIRIPHVGPYHSTGLFGDGEENVVSVKEGDSVTLNSGLTKIMGDDLIQWRFWIKNTLIAEISKRDDSMTVYDDVFDGRFRDRLKLDKQTGSLVIINTTTEHAGVYEVLINHLSTNFILTVHDGLNSVSVKEGDSITLNSDLKMKDNDQILWTFLNEFNLIAEINKQTKRMTVHDDVLDGRFRQRLKLNEQTGSLTITNTTTDDSGYYVLLIYGANPSLKTFSIYVHARLPVPVISSNSSKCSSSYCSLVCSVVNVSDVTLSWYKGNSLLSSISVSDLSISLSLPLEVEYQDKNTHSCVINNPISNQTQHLDISKLCHTCSDSVHCCGSTEAVIRLVLSALVGVATVILLVYDIRSRRTELDQAHIHT
ncbi:SLAM family member 9 [Labeo rohita]|uniref:SLAM family member 9 n=1 Tax=Labeo rohita TaxID=84645 RepID=A0ABQ8LJZ0_LABRO|nr:SLAM family member 9 [Labeo rohita]